MDTDCFYYGVKMIFWMEIPFILKQTYMFGNVALEEQIPRPLEPTGTEATPL